MKLSYEELKEWLWNSEYRHFIEFIEYQERNYPNLMADLHVYKDGSLQIVMRDKTTFRVHSTANLPRPDSVKK